MLKKLKSFRLRSGLETVEVAITLPLLTLVMFTTMQINHRWHVEKMLKLATYEAIKAGAASDGESSDAIDVFTQHTQALGIQDAQLDLDANAFDNANIGDFIWLRGTAPAASNRLAAPIILDLDPSMSCGTIWYRKEGL
jgi:hypothetical protein